MSDVPQNQGFPFGWEGFVSVRGRLDIVDKLNEARFFIGLMREEEDLARFRWLTSACLCACRAALDWLVWNAHFAREDDEKGRVPDERAVAVLRKYMRIFPKPRRDGRFEVHASPVHPLLEEVDAHRQETAHRTSLWIDLAPPVAGEEESRPGTRFAFVEARNTGQFGLLDWTPGRRVCEFCEDVIGLIEKIDAEVRSA